MLKDNYKLTDEEYKAGVEKYFTKSEEARKVFESQPREQTEKMIIYFNDPDNYFDPDAIEECSNDEDDDDDEEMGLIDKVFEWLISGDALTEDYT